MAPGLGRGLGLLRCERVLPRAHSAGVQVLRDDRRGPGLGEEFKVFSTGIGVGTSLRDAARHHMPISAEAPSSAQGLPAAAAFLAVGGPGWESFQTLSSMAHA